MSGRSANKYETWTMANGLRLSLWVLGLPDGVPPGPEAPKGPGKGGALDASSLNHRLIGRVNRLFWALAVGDLAEAGRMREDLTRLYRYQIEERWQAYPGSGAPEANSPTHDKQHYQAAAQLAWVAWYYGEQELLNLAVAWLRCKETLDRLFVAPSPSPKGKLPAILEPGYRAARDKGSKRGFRGARDFVREEWYRVAVDGQPVPEAVLQNPVGGDAEDAGNVDMASLWYFAHLPGELQALIGIPLRVPPLADPITLQRRGGAFIASMEYKPASMAEVQIFAGWVDGGEVYGFDADPVPQLAGARVQVIAGESILAPTVEAPSPPALPPGRPVKPPRIGPSEPVWREPGLEDLPPRLRALVEAGHLSLEQAVDRARRNYGAFAKRFPAPAPEARS